mgnify:CR=1 FL=1
MTHDIKWLIEQLKRLDEQMPGGVVTDFSHDLYLRVEEDAISPYRSGKKKVNIELSFDIFR